MADEHVALATAFGRSAATWPSSGLVGHSRSTVEAGLVGAAPSAPTSVVSVSLIGRSDPPEEFAISAASPLPTASSDSVKGGASAGGGSLDRLPSAPVGAAALMSARSTRCALGGGGGHGTSRLLRIGGCGTGCCIGGIGCCIDRASGALAAAARVDHAGARAYGAESQ